MVLQVDSISKSFAGVQALNNVTFNVQPFETLGIIGESGSGKTTLAKILVKLIRADTGTFCYDAHHIKNFHKDVQLIFQNPYASLDPSMRVKDIVAEPLLVHHVAPAKEALETAAQALFSVGLDRSALSRYPREFSGGQRQRICIARALVCTPKLLILDEPLSSLDLTVQAQLLELLLSIKKKNNLTYLFISHNLALIHTIANRVIVMHKGMIVEQGTREKVFNEPTHNYTKELLNAFKHTINMPN